MNTHPRSTRTRRVPNLPVLQALIDVRFPNRSDLARAVGTSPGYIHDIENGRRHGSEHILEAIADALDVELDVITIKREAA